MRGVGGVCGARVGQREEACGAEREEKGVCVCVCDREREGSGCRAGEVCVCVERIWRGDRRRRVCVFRRSGGEMGGEKSVAQRKTGLLTSQ